MTEGYGLPAETAISRVMGYAALATGLQERELRELAGVDAPAPGAARTGLPH